MTKLVFVWPYVVLCLGIAALGATLVANPAKAVHTQLDNCYQDPFSEAYYARATSGFGTTVRGTQVITLTPTSWSVDSPDSAWDEAAWLVKETNGNNALEVGFYSGWFPYDNSWTDGLVPFYTVNNGSPGFRLYGQYVPGGAWAYMEANHWAAARVGGYEFNIRYSVGTPRLNLSQGEIINSDQTWMGGGAGEAFWGFWGDGSYWYAWGHHNDCSNSPYWITSQGPYAWTNGGYGN
jgi:hypothetical protein